MLAANLIWEVLQLPLYTLWTTGAPREVAWAAIHCTLGDGLIAGAALALGWLIAGLPPLDRPVPIRLIVFAVIAGVGFTLFSEWRSTQVTHAWTYSALMPIIPGTVLGLTPILQWIVLPTAGLWGSLRGVG